MALRLLLGARASVSVAVAVLVFMGCPPLDDRQKSEGQLRALSEQRLSPSLVQDGARSSEAAQAERPTDEAERQVNANAGVVAEEVPLLAALSKETVVYSEPDYSSSKLGFLRQGATVRRSVEAVGHHRCPGGWYRVAPMGYVCINKAATLDLNHPLLELARRRPLRDEGLPYTYARARFPTPPLYTKIPSAEEQAQVELDLRGHKRRTAYVKAWDAAPYTELPEHLLAGERIPRPFGYPVLSKPYTTGQALPQAGFAFLDFFESGGRRWGLTTDLSIIPLDRVEPVEASEFAGLRLADGQALPVVFVKGQGAYLYEGNPRKTGLKLVRKIGYREGFSLTDKRVVVGGIAYLETRAGHWLRDEQLVRIAPMRQAPRWAKGGRSWIEVSILNQTLVAYEGERPVYATLVSTGADGLGDPEESYSTVRGTFLIHTKHVSATMSSDSADDEFDLRDVPYVQYFHEGYAFHAAYWHNSFGRPKSHGCINLSPEDARWLFHWSQPSVPQHWHGALSLRDGTLVYIHP